MLPSFIFALNFFQVVVVVQQIGGAMLPIWTKYKELFNIILPMNKSLYLRPSGPA